MNQRQPNSRMCFVCGVENDFGLQLEFYNSGTALRCAPDGPQTLRQNNDSYSLIATP